MIGKRSSDSKNGSRKPALAGRSSAVSPGVPDANQIFTSVACPFARSSCCKALPHLVGSSIAKLLGHHASRAPSEPLGLSPTKPQQRFGDESVKSLLYGP